MINMSVEQAYINGFVKRAAEYGYSEEEAAALYKEALLLNYFLPADKEKKLSVDKTKFNPKTLPNSKTDLHMGWEALTSGKGVKKEYLLDKHHVFGARYEDLVKATSGHSLYGTKGKKTKDFMKDMHPIPPITLKDIAEKLRGATKEQIAGNGGFHAGVRDRFTNKKLNKKEVNTFASLLDNYADQGASMYPLA